MLSMVLEQMLHQLGYTTTQTCEDEEEAYAFLEGSDTVQLALLDFHLKDGNSAGLARDLQKQGVPIAMMSGSSLGEMPSHLANVPHLQKPFFLQDIEKLLQEMQIGFNRKVVKT